MRSTPRYARITGLTFALALAAAAAGCGSSPGQVSGKVTYKDAPLKGGTVTFIPIGEGKTFSTTIAQDGTYTVDKVAAGKYKVCVETETLKGGAVGPMPAPPISATGKIKNAPPPGATPPEGYKMANPSGAIEQARRYVPIPPEYGDPEKTTLTIEVKGGTQPHDIPLS